LPAAQRISGWSHAGEVNSQLLGEAAEGLGGVLCEGWAVAEAADIEVDFSEAADGLFRLRRIDVEEADEGAGADGGDSVAGEEGAGARDVDGDAARSMAGDVDDAGAAVEVDFVAAFKLAVYGLLVRRRGYRRLRR